MKNAKTTAGEPQMRAEYDFRGGVRGKYAARYAEGTDVILLEPAVNRRKAVKPRTSTASKRKPRR